LIPQATSPSASLPVSRAHLPRLLAALLAAAGLVDLLSALTPALEPRVLLIRGFIGGSAMQMSHTATVLVGLCLLMLARSIGRRQARGAQLALVALLISAVVNLLKGLDYEEASFCLFVAALIWQSRDQFTVGALPISWRNAGSRTLWLAGLIVLYAEAGAFLLGRNVRVLLTMGGHPAPFPLADFLGLWANQQTVLYTGQRGEWFRHSLRALVLLGALYAIVKLLRPLIPISPASVDERRRARTLLVRFGTDTLSYFHLRADRSYIFAPEGEGFVSFVVHGNVALLGGDPVAAPGALEAVVRHAVHVLTQEGLRPCVVGASDQALRAYRAAGMRGLKIGEEAVIDLRAFSVQSLAKRVRRAARHVESLGIRIEIGPACSFAPAVAAQFESVSRIWKQARGNQDWGFSMTSGPLPAPQDRDHQIVAALAANDDGTERLLGFLTLAPIPAACGVSLDHMRRLPDAPNGLIEALILCAAEHFRDHGYTSFSLNFSPLCDREHPEGEPRAARAARQAVFEHARHLPLRSLYLFNKKFNPTWSCRYWLYQSTADLPNAVYATLRAEVGPPTTLLPARLAGLLRFPLHRAQEETAV
jgi:lysyl-tRNA synthetase class 2